MTTATLDPVAAVEAFGVMPEAFWNHEDDACDCTFQRIGLWKNPYIGETLEVRMCCIWAELYKLFPQHVRVTPAYLVDDEAWAQSVMEWNGESAMPRSIWYRQLARQTGRSLPEIRAAYGHLEPPQGTPKPVPQEVTVNPIDALMAMVTHLADRIVDLEAKLGS